MMSDTPVSKDNPAWLKLMAGPGFFVFFAALVYVYSDRSIDPAPPGQLGAGFWPKMCLVGILLAAGLKAFELFRSRGKASGEGGECKEMDNGKLALMMLLLVLVVPAIGLIGFPLASVLFFILFLYLAGLKKPVTLALVSVLGTVGLIYVFVKIVYIPLPRGEWLFDDLTLMIYRALLIM
jgi:putative tricarboxylic transport membrane protein